MSPPEELDFFGDIFAADTPFSSLLEDEQPSCEGLEQFLSDEVPPADSCKDVSLRDVLNEVSQLSDECALYDLDELPTAQEAAKERVRAKNRRNQKAYRERLKV